MIHVKEALLRDKFDNFRTFLDSNYNTSHAKLSDKLTDLSKDVNSLNDNLSKMSERSSTRKISLKKVRLKVKFNRHILLAELRPFKLQ